MKNFSLALVIGVAGCGAADRTTCYAPPYTDLSKWFTTGATFEVDCGVTVGAALRSEPQIAGLVRGEWYGEPGDLAWVDADFVVRAGSGRLSLELFGDKPVARTTPQAGRVSAFGVAPADHLTVSFLAFAGSPGFEWSVRRVLMRSVPVQLANLLLTSDPSFQRLARGVTDESLLTLPTLPTFFDVPPIGSVDTHD